MAWLNELPGMGAAEERAAKAMSFPVGAASPLWFAFGAAAGAGVAYWLATRWTRQTNLEALLEAPAKVLQATVEALPQTPPVSEAAIAAIGAAVDPTPIVEIVLEAAEEFETTATAAANDLVEAIAEALPAPPAAEPPALEIATVAAAAPEPAPAPAPQPAVPDDLTRIAGIGPKLAAALAERGVTRFADLAAWGEAELAEADKALGLKGRAVRDAWVAQARRFAEA